MLVYAAKWHISRQVFTPLRRISAYESRHATPCNREHHRVKAQGGPDKKPTESKSLSPEDCPEELGNRQHPGDSAAPRAQECERRPQVPSRGLITEDRRVRPVRSPGNTAIVIPGADPGKTKMAGLGWAGRSLFRGWHTARQPLTRDEKPGTRVSSQVPPSSRGQLPLSPS